MPELSITINHQSYTVACEPGDEPLLRRFGEEIDQRLSELAKAANASGSQFSQAQLLVFCSLMLAEELDLAKKATEEATLAAANSAASLAASVGCTICRALRCPTRSFKTARAGAKNAANHRYD